MADEFLSEFTKPNGSVTLYHYPTGVGGEEIELDPKLLGKNSWSQAEKKADPSPKSFFYLDPKKDREQRFPEHSPVYTTNYPAALIYDAAHDPKKVVRRLAARGGFNMAHFLNVLKRLGYHGVFYSGSFPTVAMWKRVKVRRKLARMKAPAGGMIVNNLYQKGGQFSQLPLTKIRDAVARWRQKMKLSRFNSLVDTRPFHEDVAAAPFGDFREQHKSHGPQVLADRLDDDGDPRAELIRRNETSHLFEAVAAKTGLSGESLRPQLTVRHNLPDGTRLELIHYRQGATRGWGVAWENESPDFRFRAAMTHDEFRSWLKKWPINELKKILTSIHNSKVKLSRTDLLPGHLHPLLPAGGEKLTPDQVAQIADAHGLPHPDLTSREGRENFMDALVTARQPVANLKKQLLDKSATDNQVLAYMVPHMIADSNAHGNSTSWYSSDVDKMEQGVRHIFGKGWHPGSPHQTLLKVLIAAMSAGQEPEVNVPNAVRVVKEAGGDWTNLPHTQYARLERWLAKQNPIARHAGLTPQEHLNWWLAHDKANLAKAEYRNYPAYVTVHDRLIGYEAPKSAEIPPGATRHNKLVILPGMGKWMAKGRGRRNAAFPVVDDNGDIQAKAWTQRDSNILGAKMDDIAHIVRYFNGNLTAVQHWLINDHPREEFERVVGHPYVDKDEVLKKDEKVPGTFFLGPKFGAFALNLHQNTHPSLGRFLTADLWWTRTWNRFMGTMRDAATGKSQKTPRSPTERKRMWAAAKVAAKACGFRSVADLQANLWYYEQHLDRVFGGNAKSTSVVDGINAAMKLSRRKPTLTDALTIRAERLKAANRLVPLPRLLHAMLTAADRVYNPHGIGKVKLARSTPYNIAFVSPSQRESSTFEQAQAGLRSPEMRQLEQDTPGGASGIELWKGGAEESRLVRGPDIDRQAAMLGKKYNQKGVVTFKGGPGADVAHVVVLPQGLDPVTVHDTFMRHGVEYKTIHGSVVNVLDPGGSLAPNVKAAAADLRARVRSIPGTFRFIGSDDRQSAQKAYDAVLQTDDPVKLARSLAGLPVVNPPIPQEEWHPFWIHPTTSRADSWAHELHAAYQRLPRGSVESENSRAALVNGDAGAYRALLDKLHDDGYADDETMLTHRVVAAMMYRGKNARDARRVLDRTGEVGSEGRNERLQKVLTKLEPQYKPRRKTKLARPKGWPHWQSPDGVLHPLDNMQIHEDWARQNQAASGDLLKMKGWNRIKSSNGTLYVDRDEQNAGPMNYKQRAALINHAIETGHKELVTDDITPRTIWTRDFDEPQQLRRLYKAILRTIPRI